MKTNLIILDNLRMMGDIDILISDIIERPAEYDMEIWQLALNLQRFRNQTMGSMIECNLTEDYEEAKKIANKLILDMMDDMVNGKV